MNEETSASVSVIFDDKSLDILKKVDRLHRNSLINIGLALVSRTGYYKTLTGDLPEDLENVVNLSELDKVIKEKEAKDEPKAKAKTSGDMFGDDFF